MLVMLMIMRYHFTSAIVAVVSSQFHASSCVSWSNYKPLSDFVGQLRGSWSAIGHSQRLL